MTVSDSLGSVCDFVFTLLLDGIISEPSYREYILYSQCQDMTLTNRILPQRQYSIIKDNEIRIMDLQTTDALYF